MNVFTGKYVIITYATHVQGHFNELIHNSYNEPVIVLGMGEKWNGFMDKPKAFNDYIRFMNDYDIIIVLDGFDTMIKKSPKIAIHRFLEMQHNGIVVSKDLNIFGYNRIVYGSCRGSVTANTGMHMGFVKHLKALYTDMIQVDLKHPGFRHDDQKILNNLCKKHQLTVDNHNEIFLNVSPGWFKATLPRRYNAVFVQFPGKNDHPSQRAKPIIACFLVIALIVVLFNKNLTSYKTATIKKK